MASRTTWLRGSRWFLTIFGSPLGAQKLPNIDFLWKRVRQGTFFYRFLRHMLFFSIFGSILDFFFMKKRWRIRCIFRQPRVLFSNWQPSQNIVFYDAKATFSFFEFLFFSKKNGQKLNAKLGLEKSSKKWPNWDPKWSNNWWKLSWKILKIIQMTKKSSFLTGQFLDDFLAGQKNEKRRHAHHRSMSYPGPGVHWGTIGGTTKTTH